MTSKLTPKMTVVSEILAERMLECATAHFEAKGLTLFNSKTVNEILLVSFVSGTTSVAFSVSQNEGNTWVVCSNTLPAVITGNGIQTLKRYLKTC